MSCWTIFKMHDVHSVCFVNLIWDHKLYHELYTHVLHLSCMWIKNVFHFEFNSEQLSGLPTELPTNSILESSGLPTELPTELPTISVYGSSGQPNMHGKIPMGSPLRCPLSYPLIPYMEVVGSLICMAKFPWAAHSAAYWAAHFFIFGRSGLPTELLTELPTVFTYGNSGQPNLHGKITMGSPRAAHSVAHGHPIGSEVGSSHVFSVWEAPTLTAICVTRASIVEYTGWKTL